jgi:hypothetical protein
VDGKDEEQNEQKYKLVLLYNAHFREYPPVNIIVERLSISQ